MKIRHFYQLIFSKNNKYLREVASLCNVLPSDWYLDEVLLLAMPKKNGWGGLADGPWVMEVVVS